MSEKVLLILVDGMRADSVGACGVPAFEAFFREGTYCLQGRTVFPPVTLPCHMSLFHSVVPQRHGVTTNTYVPQNHPVDGLVERLAAAGKRTAFFYTWEELRDICAPGRYLSYSWFMSWRAFCREENLDRRATREAAAHIREFAPDFVFLYLGETDECGHHYGWMSREYLDCLRRAYGCIADICAVLPEDYSVIVTADHGGHERNHGDDLPEDMTIPMVFRGKRFPKRKALAECGILDIAPTILDVMGLEPCGDWEGHSVLEGEI